jgi:hypothetical protein
MLSTVPGTCRRGPGARPASADDMRRQLAACRPARMGRPPAASTRPASAHAGPVAERKRAHRRPGAGAANGPRPGRQPSQSVGTWPAGPLGERCCLYALACVSLTMTAMAN